MRRIGLVACCGEKLPHPAPAKDLYQSPLFKKSRAYAERYCDDWAILSAKCGLVMPDAMLAPYDETLNDKPAASVMAWAERANRLIRNAYPEAEFVVLAGKSYRTAVSGLPAEFPLSSLGIGQQLKYLGTRISGPRYFAAITNRDYIKIDGERRPFWEFLDEQPPGWLTSLAYKRKDLPGGKRVIDCGAWSYREHDVPRFGKELVTPEWALRQYEEYARPGDFVIAPDHMLIPGLGDLEARRLFNLASARGFFTLSKLSKFVPMAVVHGETIKERLDTVKNYLDLG
jgi:hypothetical protein